MAEFEVKFESFPIRLVDKEGKVQVDLGYSIFHHLEGRLDALDEAKSNWQGNAQLGVPHIFLDETKFDHRPIFICDKVYVPLMRDDLKQAIEQRGLTGFCFYKPEEYGTGRYSKMK